MNVSVKYGKGLWSRLDCTEHDSDGYAITLVFQVAGLSPGISCVIPPENVKAIDDVAIYCMNDSIDKCSTM